MQTTNRHDAYQQGRAIAMQGAARYEAHKAGRPYSDAKTRTTYNA